MARGSVGEAQGEAQDDLVENEAAVAGGADASGHRTRVTDRFNEALLCQRRDRCLRGACARHAFEARKVWDDPIVTEVAPFEAFYPAEAYHQDYYVKNADRGYCRLVIAPKVAKLRAQFLDRLEKE